MRAHDLKLLSEVAMNPTSLRQLASKIQATAGMEFEMYVPNSNNGDNDDYDQERDYSNDPRATDIEDILDFFRGDGDYNSRGDISRLQDNLQEAYEEWAMEQRDEEWRNVAVSRIYDYIEENEWDEEEELKEALLLFLPSDRVEELINTKASDYTVEDQRAMVKANSHMRGVLDDRAQEEYDNQGRTYDAAWDEWLEDEGSELASEYDWLKSEGIRDMSDVESNYDITWPYWTSPESGGTSIDDVGEEFSRMIGRKVTTGGYHSGKRRPGEYNLEPDGSLDEPDSSEDSGMEFVSPPLPLQDMLGDLRKVKAWADSNKCYTNESTGLHINVSVPGVSSSTLDYVKLAIMLGDKYVLEQFGRAGNSYCKSAMKNIQDVIRIDPSKANRMLDMMRNGLGDLASHAIHSGSTNKYVSINNKDNYIEFRSPGGDWLGENFDKIESTLNRCVVALDAAISPTKYRQEYLKKLYMLLDVKSTVDPIAVFAQYVAGTIPKEQLTTSIRQLQLQRTINKTPQQSSTQKYWFNVSGTGFNGSIEVVGRNPEEAKVAARNSWGVRAVDYPDEMLMARPIRRYVPDQDETPPAQDLPLWYVHPQGRPGSEIMVRAASYTEAVGLARTTRPDIFAQLPFNDIRASRNSEVAQRNNNARL